MAIQVRNGRWQVRVSVKGIRESHTVDSLEEARAVERAMKDALRVYGKWPVLPDDKPMRQKPKGAVPLPASTPSLSGYGDETLKAIAEVCIRFRVQTLRIEDNFGDGMFLALITPVITRAWEKHNKDKPEGAQGGTVVEGMKSPKVQKELRILASLEPVTQGHRLVVSSSVIEQDFQSIQQIDSEETRARYSLFYQMTHLTRDRDCLMKDDRIEGLAAACAQFSEVIGVNPWEMAGKRDEDRMAEELEKLFEDADEVAGRHDHSPHWKRHKHAIRPN